MPRVEFMFIKDTTSRFVSYLEVSLVLRARLPPPVTAVDFVSARRLHKFGPDDDIVVERRQRRLLRRVEGRRQLRRHRRCQDVRRFSLF